MGVSATIKRLCIETGCQCGKCERFDELLCCALRPVHCPGTPQYDPEYKCPDFIPKEKGGHENADT